MLIDVQQSVRRLDPVISDYIASSVEKMDTSPVGVKKKMIINDREDLRGDTRLQARKKNNQALFKSLYQGTKNDSSKDVPTNMRKKMDSLKKCN